MKLKMEKQKHEYKVGDKIFVRKQGIYEITKIQSFADSNDPFIGYKQVYDQEGDPVESDWEGYCVASQCEPAKKGIERLIDYHLAVIDQLELLEL